jgi:hypothetical protein
MLEFFHAKDETYAELAKAFYQLRDEVFAQKYGWEEPRGAERDRYDDNAIFVLAVEGNEVLAGCRVVFKDGPSEPLPIEVATGIRLPDGAVEVSRVINVSGDPRLLGQIYSGVLGLVVDSGFAEAYAVIRSGFLAAIERQTSLPFRVERIAGEPLRKGEESFLPVRLLAR